MAERTTAKKSMITSAIFAANRARSMVYIGVEILLFLINILLLLNVSRNYRPSGTVCLKPAPASALSEPLSGRDPILWLPVVKKTGLKPFDAFLLSAFHTKGFEGRRYKSSQGFVIEFDVLLTTFDPYTGNIQRLRPNQKINQVPGLRNMTDDIHFVARSRELDFFPKSYIIPAETEVLMEEVGYDPDKLWIRIRLNAKGRSNVVRAKDIDFENKNIRYLLREFVDNPYLVDQRKFTVSVFVLVTSVDPFKVYIYDDVMIEYSGKDYDHSDLSDQGWFLSGHLNTARFWELESMRKFGDDVISIYPQRRMLEEHFRETTGKKTTKIMDKIHDAVEQLFLQEGGAVKDRMKQMRSPESRNVFELMKWRFVMDDQGDLFLLGVEIDPTLSKKGTHDDETAFMRQMYYSMISTVGVPSSYLHDQESTSEERTRVRDSDVFVYQDLCYTESCSSCKLGCELCSHCLSSTNAFMLKSTQREQLHKAHQRRIMPSTRTHFKDGEPGEGEKKRFTDKSDVLLGKWLDLKCENEVSWCS